VAIATALVCIVQNNDGEAEALRHRPDGARKLPLALASRDKMNVAVVQMGQVYPHPGGNIGDGDVRVGVRIG
jgi:hypothetical protein